MVKGCLLALALICAACSLNAQMATVIWDKNYGGSMSELAFGMQMTPDSGFVIVGRTESNDSDVNGLHSPLIFDGWIMKADKNGVLQWQRCIGSTGSDLLNSVRCTPDGGYIVCGVADTTDGDFDSLVSHGAQDMWVAKLSSSGATEWQKLYGGTLGDESRCVNITADGGYILAGNGLSNDGDISGHHGGADIFILKLDDTGAVLWQKCLGGSSLEVPKSISQTSDGGYIVAGYTSSADGDVTVNHGDYDFWVVKLDGSGIIEWQKAFGGSDRDEAHNVIETADGGYIAIGVTASVDGDVSFNHGYTDAWVVKMSTNGTMEWEKAYGGSLTETGNAIYEDGNGGYYMAAGTRSLDGDVIFGINGNSDYWMVHIDGQGNIILQTCFGGIDPDACVDMFQNADGSLVLGGTGGYPSGDISHSNGGLDFWVVRVSEPVSVQERHKAQTGITVNIVPGDATYVSLPKGYEEAQLRLYTMTGQQVYPFINRTAQNIRVSLDGLPTAIYLLQIRNGNELLSYSISK